MGILNFLCPIMLLGCAWSAQSEKKKKKIDKLIVAMPLPKQGEKKYCENLIVAMPLPKQGNKKKISNCGNGIAENGGEKKRGSEIYGRVKKTKKRHVHNIFTTFSQ